MRGGGGGRWWWWTEIYFVGFHIQSFEFGVVVKAGREESTFIDVLVGEVAGITIFDVWHGSDITKTTKNNEKIVENDNKNTKKA